MVDAYHRVWLSVGRPIAAPPAEAPPVTRGGLGPVIGSHPGLVPGYQPVLAGGREDLGVAGASVACRCADELDLPIADDAVDPGRAQLGLIPVLHRSAVVLDPEDHRQGLGPRHRVARPATRNDILAAQGDGASGVVLE